VQGYVQGYHGLVKTLADNIYYYQDELGSTSHIASSSGQLLEYYKYNLYGKPRYFNAAGTEQGASSYRVQDLGNGGSRWIPELSLYDDRNRFMSPDLGRFLQPDPIGFKGDASNLYRYCANDWANRVDPTGTQDALPHNFADNLVAKVDENAIARGDLSVVGGLLAAANRPNSPQAPAIEPKDSTQKVTWKDSGNWNDKNIEHHVVPNGSLGRDAGETASRIRVSVNRDGSLTANHNLNWFVEERYKNTDVVTRELQHVKDWRSWELSGAGNNVVTNFQKNFGGPAAKGASELQQRLNGSHLAEHERQIRAYDCVGCSHNLTNHPATPLKPEDITKQLDTF
jgi:RHS repeat-associated protein